MSPEPAAINVLPNSIQTPAPLTVSRVVGNLQLLLALRRSRRLEEMPGWQESSRAA